MAIITKGSNVEKGNEVEFTLNITDLLSHASVSGDSYFSDQSNWDKVFLNYKSAGYQKEILVFNDVDSGTSSAANFGVFSDARDLFEVHSIIIMDKQGGCLKIKRSDLVVADFDVDFSSGGGGVSYDVAALNTTIGSEYAFGSGNILFPGGTAIDFLSDGSIIVISDKSGEQIKKFNIDGSNNETFDTNFTGTNSKPHFVFVDSNDDIYSAVQNDKILKLDSDGNEITSFATNYGTFTGIVYGIVEMPDGSLLLNGSDAFGFIKRINKDGTDFVGNSFNSNVSGNFSLNYVTDAGLLSDNSIVLVGSFIYNDGVNTFNNNLVVLNDDGTINLTKTNLYSNNDTYEIGSPFQLKIINDDLYIAGSNSVGINGNRTFGSILSDGNINTTFQDNVNAINLFDGARAINDILFADNGRILLCSKAQDIGGNSNRDFFIAVNSDGTLDSTFTTNNLDTINFTTTAYLGFEGVTHGSFNSNVFFVVHQGEIDSTNYFMFAISNT